MADEAQGIEEVETPQSIVLDEGEITEVLVEEGTAVEEEVTLPSEEEEFSIPEKFKDKSPEEIAKAYMELERKLGEKSSKQEEETPKQEETPKEEGDIKLSDEEYQQYAKEILDKGELPTEKIEELKKKGFSEEQIQEEVIKVREFAEFQKYKQEKVLKEVLEPLGGGIEKFQEVAAWAKETMAEADIVAFNAALAQATPAVQRAMLKGLYTDYDKANTQSQEPLHTNSTPSSPSKAYATQEEFFKDISSPEYANNPKFREAVEKKMAKSDIF